MKLWLRFTVAFGVACLALPGCATRSPETSLRVDMQRRLGDIKLSKGQYELAIREYRRSLELDPKDPETYFGLAEAYRETKIRQARGDADRFLATLKEYKKAPYITRKRLYLEMMQEVMPTVEKVILDEKGSGVLPILSLKGAAAVKELNKR